jgi:hypothetical protein
LLNEVSRAALSPFGGSPRSNGHRLGKATYADPATWIAGATAVKTAIDSPCAGIGIANDVRLVAGGTPDQQTAIDHALNLAGGDVLDRDYHRSGRQSLCCRRQSRSC